MRAFIAEQREHFSISLSILPIEMQKQNCLTSMYIFIFNLKRDEKKKKCSKPPIMIGISGKSLLIQNKCGNDHFFFYIQNENDS